MWLGIDFGTCLSSAALMIGGNLKMVKEPNQQGFSLPSSIYITESGEIRVGHAADNLRKQNPNRYRREFKRDWGTKTPYLVDDQQIFPEDLAALVIKKLKNEAEEMIRGLRLSPIDAAAIAVPATYQPYKRSLMEKAGKAAGFSQIELLEEPVAAAAYYTQNYSFSDEEIILVYDLGGGTFDATLIQRRQVGFVILAAPVGLSHCGGIDFDRQIFDDIKSRCSSNLGELLDRRNQSQEAELARLIVSNFCRDFKHQLVQDSEYEDLLIVPGVAPEKYHLSRDAFYNAITPLIAETIQLCHQLVQNARIAWNAVNQVLLVGGSCRIPYVQAAVERELKRPVFRVDDPELAVCQGAAIYGDNLFSKSEQKIMPKPEPTLNSDRKTSVAIKTGKHTDYLDGLPIWEGWT